MIRLRSKRGRGLFAPTVAASGWVVEASEGRLTLSRARPGALS